MELKLIMSGVPNGESYWGPDEDASFFGNLYASSEVNYKFDVKIRHNEKGNYAYYHYLVYNIINDYSGRAGAYLGMTLRLDQYCSDYRSIFNALEMVFRKIIVGSYLKPTNGNRFQFAFMSFEQISENIKNLEKNIKDILSPVLAKNDISPIKFVPNSKVIYKLNLEESFSNDANNVILQNGFCSFSPEYVSVKLEEARKEFYNKGYLSRQNDIDLLNQQIKKLEEDINTKKERIKELEERKVVQPTNTVVYSTTRHTEESEEENFNILGYIQTALAAISVILLIYIIFIALPDINHSKNYSPTEIEESYQETTECSFEEMYKEEPTYQIGEIVIDGYDSNTGLTIGTEYDVNLIHFEQYPDLSFKASSNVSIISNSGTKYKIRINESTETARFICIIKKNGTDKNELLSKKEFKIKVSQ